MSDPITVTAIIVAIASAIISIINTMHIRKCKSVCCNSDCTNPPNTPTTEP